MATHSWILAWRSPWTEEPGGLQSIGSQRVGHDWSYLAHRHAHCECLEFAERIFHRQNFSWDEMLSTAAFLPSFKSSLMQVFLNFISGPLYITLTQSISFEASLCQKPEAENTHLFNRNLLHVMICNNFMKSNCFPKQKIRVALFDSFADLLEVIWTRIAGPAFVSLDGFHMWSIGRRRGRPFITVMSSSERMAPKSWG